MRKIMLLLLVGSLIGGCSGQQQAGTNGTDSGAAQTPPGNSAPTISGKPPPSIRIDEAYSFTPFAADADGDPHTFHILNKPGWATFDPTTGAIGGRPTQGDVGTYDNIIISVSDGKSSVSLRPFSITVSQWAPGTVTLSWVAPTQNSDGSPLRDLAGYKIYYRKSSENYRQEIRIENPGITTYIVQNLSPGVYYFSATAINSSDLESSFSEEITKTVD